MVAQAIADLSLGEGASLVSVRCHDISNLLGQSRRFSTLDCYFTLFSISKLIFIRDDLKKKTRPHNFGLELFPFGVCANDGASRGSGLVGRDLVDSGVGDRAGADREARQTLSLWLPSRWWLL
jgi:hypothetical protein